MPGFVSNENEHERPHLKFGSWQTRRAFSRCTHVAAVSRLAPVRSRALHVHAFAILGIKRKRDLSFQPPSTALVGCGVSKELH